MSEIPLGKKENQKLEFKSKDVLDDLTTVGKGVVGMLNAVGGDLWIGIVEEGGIAVKIEPIEDIESAVRKVRDYLIDTIEPSPTEDEFTLGSVDNMVIQVKLKEKRKRKPYAHLKGGGRFFVVRISDRLRPMARQELADHFKNVSEQDGEEKIFYKEWERFFRDKPAGLCMLVKPLEQIDLDIQNEQIKKYLQDPTSTGNRPDGWDFTNPYLEIRHKQGRRFLGAVEKGHLVELQSNGIIEFFISIDRLLSEDHKLLDPFPLMEYPVSIFRLAKALYQDKSMEEDSQLMVNLALIEINGLALRPGSPYSIQYITSDKRIGPHVFQDGNDFNLLKPKKFPWKEVSENPDYCGLRLVEAVYEAFGFSQKDMPAEYDRTERRLIFKK